MLTQEHLQGLWQRDWLRSQAVEDNTTQVFWAQADNVFVDIRIPLQRPLIDSNQCLADLDIASLELLMQAEGFAGFTQLDNDVCTWNRIINWHGESDSIDAGKLWFKDDENTLMEDGVHADYQELWKRNSMHVFTVNGVSFDGLSGWVLYSNSLFIFGVGYTEAASSNSLIKTLQGGHIPNEIATHFSSIYCIGKWQGNVGLSDLCTNPFMENKVVITKNATGIQLHLQTFNGDEIICQT